VKRSKGGPGKPETISPLTPIKGSIPQDERTIIFERTPDAPQLNWITVNQSASHVNNSLGKVAPAHVRTEKFRVSQRGVLSTTARQGASAAILLHFKKELIEAARKGDDSIINVRSNESWMELKILVPYAVYRDENGIERLREEIEAGNTGVAVPPFSIRWMRPKEVIEEIWRNGTLPAGKASVVFKVPGKEAARRLLQEIWVNGNKFRAEIYVRDRADTLCGKCRQWGYAEFRCREQVPRCGMCSGEHKLAFHKCEVAVCGRVERGCSHIRAKCPNCGLTHFAQDGRCKAKREAIAIARGLILSATQEHEMVTSGDAPPIL
jgi:hypothetical protein